MAQKTFNINATEVVAYTNRLEKLSRSALPLAVRSTLNDAAFDMKSTTAPANFEDKFIIRKKTFLRANSTAVKCKNTFNINEMESAYALKNAGVNLFEQEHGGNVENRTYIPQTEARVGGADNRLVSKKFYIQNIKPQQKATKQNLIKAAFKAGKNGFLIYDDILYQIRTITNKPRFFMKLSAIYNYKEGRSVNLNARPFMAPAALQTEAKINGFFEKNAKYQFNKILKK